MLATIMRHTLGIAALSLLLSVPSLAHKIEVGTGIFCDTQQQVERFVALYEGDARAAMNAVNAEANDPTACIAGNVAFIRGPEFLTTRTTRGA